MTVRRLAETQPESFAFTAENAEWARAQLRKYPEGREASAIIPILWRAQAQHGGWLPEPAISHVAGLLGLARIRVLEIATFYSMFNLAPVGRHHVQLCGTTPCWLRGADDLKSVCRRVIGEPGHVTEDGALSWVEVECLGACCNAPMVQINDDYYEDLSAHGFEQLLADLRAGRTVKPGSRAGRTSSEPAGGATTLREDGLLDMWKSRARPGLAEPAPEPVDTAAHSASTPLATQQNRARPDVADRSEAARTLPPGDVPESEPERLDAPPSGGADDLKRIKGVGPKIESLLHDLGVFTLAQIAAWTPENVAWVDRRLKFKGRIERERWISQAHALVAIDGKR